jgi:hypothetical protein
MLMSSTPTVHDRVVISAFDAAPNQVGFGNREPVGLDAYSNTVGRVLAHTMDLMVNNANREI